MASAYLRWCSAMGGSRVMRLEKLRLGVEDLGYSIDRLFEDRGVARRGRPGIHDLRAAISSGELVWPLFVLELHELASSARELRELAELARRAGGALCSLDELFDSSVPSSWERLRWADSWISKASSERAMQQAEARLRKHGRRSIPIEHRLIIAPERLAKLWEMPHRGRMLSLRAIEKILRGEGLTCYRSMLVATLDRYRREGQIDDQRRAENIEKFGRPGRRPARSVQVDRQLVAWLWNRGCSKDEILRQLELRKRSWKLSRHQLDQILAELSEERALFEELRDAEIRGRGAA